MVQNGLGIGSPDHVHGFGILIALEGPGPIGAIISGSGQVQLSGTSTVEEGLVRATGAAAGIAVVSAICGAEDPEAAARALA